MITAKLLLAYLLQSADVYGLSVDTTKIDPQEAYCLAENIYYEAGGEDIRGQIAVASVTINRTKDPRFPSTVCGVVQQSVTLKSTNKPICSFSWYCEDKKRDKDISLRNKDGTENLKLTEKFKNAIIIALKVLDGDIKDNTRGATHFHNPSQSQPSWRSSLIKTVSLGNHDFYK